VLLAVGAAAAATPAPRSVTRAQAAAVASAMNLRHSDLPGLMQQANPQTAQDRKLDAQASACAGAVPPSRAYTDTQSPAFISSGQPSVAVASSVEIMPSTALVASDFHAVEQPRALPCLVTELDTQLRSSLPSSDRLGAGTATRLGPVASGVTDSFAVRIAFPVGVPAGKKVSTVTLYFDEVGFAWGQAEVSVEVQSTGVVPSSSLEKRLAGVLVARARATLG
jgi:hypothetical protein